MKINEIIIGIFLVSILMMSGCSSGYDYSGSSNYVPQQQDTQSTPQQTQQASNQQTSNEISKAAAEAIANRLMDSYLGDTNYLEIVNSYKEDGMWKIDYVVKSKSYNEILGKMRIQVEATSGKIKWVTFSGGQTVSYEEFLQNMR